MECIKINTKEVNNRRVNSMVIDCIFVITMPILLFISETSVVCEQGDWLTCSGAVEHQKGYYVYKFIALTIFLLNFVLLPVLFKNSIGKSLMRLKIVNSVDKTKVSGGKAFLRSMLLLFTLPIYLMLTPFSLAEIILIKTQTLDNRLIDKLIKISVVSSKDFVE